MSHADESPLTSTMADEVDFHPLLHTYAELLRDSLALLEAAEPGANDEQVRKTAHDLKGSGGAYGFDPITDTGAQLETSLRTGAGRTEVDEQIATLCSLLRRAIRGIEEL